MDLAYLVQHRGTPDVRAVLSDYELTSHGRKSRALHAVSLVNATDDATDDATAADAAADTAATADADATAATADDATAADAAAAADATAATADFSRLLAKEINMREGLKLIKLPGYYGPVRVGWLRRIEGDNYELLPGSVLVIRTSGGRALAELAADGPLADHRLTDNAGTSHDVNEFRVWQAIDCGDVWREYVPQPKEWR